MGADQAFLLTNEAFAGVDTAAAALTLGKAIERIGDYDLILTGQRALDTGASQIGPRLAEYLGLPQVLGVREVSSLSDGKLTAKRNWRGGHAEVEVGLPALLGIAPQANQPRYPHGARIMSAYREWEVTTWGLADLGLTQEELSPLIGLQREAFPPERTLGEIITGTPDEAARELAQVLRGLEIRD
jgi:electron transfer flavoprotein beta subunit